MAAEDRFVADIREEDLVVEDHLDQEKVSAVEKEVPRVEAKAEVLEDDHLLEEVSAVEVQEDFLKVEAKAEVFLGQEDIKFCHEIVGFLLSKNLVKLKNKWEMLVDQNINKL